jgi:hypothetical protein
LRKVNGSTRISLVRRLTRHDHAAADNPVTATKAIEASEKGRHLAALLIELSDLAAGGPERGQRRPVLELAAAATAAGQAAAPDPTMTTVFLVFAAAAVFVLPSLALLYALAQRELLE